MYIFGQEGYLLNCVTHIHVYYFTMDVYSVLKVNEQTLLSVLLLMKSNFVK